jgi:hypothetical protein
MGGEDVDFNNGFENGTASQSLTAVTGIGTRWHAAMVNSHIVFADGVSSGNISAVGSSTSATVATSQVVAPQAFTVSVDVAGGFTPVAITTAGRFRSSYGREAIGGLQSSITLSAPLFPGGAITSGWISARLYKASSGTSLKYFGFAKSGTNSSLWVGNDAANKMKIALWKYDNTTWTQLASEPGASMVAATLNKLDMQVVSYGAAATVRVYLNGGASPVLTYTGDVVAGTAVSLDRVVMGQNSNIEYVSEIIVADDDTRALSLATLAPSANGDLNQWTNTYTNINPTILVDSTYISDATSGDVFECNLSASPSGSFSVPAVKVIARAAQTGAGIASLSVGVKTNGAVNEPAAAALALGFASMETYYATNPVTASAWTAADLDALQINLKSAP